MSILIGFAVAALKAGVSGAVENEVFKDLGIYALERGSDKLGQYLKEAQEELSAVLNDKNLEKMNVPKDQVAYIKAEIKELIQSVSIDEALFRDCRYDADSLAEALYKKYREQKFYSVEHEEEIRKIISIMSEKAIKLEKERDGFIKDILIDIANSKEDMMSLLRKVLAILDEFIKSGTTDSERDRKLECNKRLPDRTEEYCKKWTENMFLNDFDEDDEDAGVNIPLWQLYQPTFYRLNGRDTNLQNLAERLDKCTQGEKKKSRMLLILGQPGMGKSTLITWFLDEYQKKTNDDRKEILVYRFTDININWRVEINEVKSNGTNVDDSILECLNMKKEDLNGKILILDGFDEVEAGNNRVAILNRLYNIWAADSRIKDFSLLVTCRENYIEDLSRLSFPYITLQPWNEKQIEDFCENYGSLTKSQIPKQAIDKMKEMKNVFGIPIILYMALALEITVKYESSVVEVYDQIFSLEGGIYDRCLKRDILLRWDDAHRISEIKKQIHQFSREISMWMFENRPQQAEILKDEHEKIRDKIFEKNECADKSQKKDVLIGNYFRIVRCYDGIDTEKLTFVHRSIYEYFVAETIFSEIRDAIDKRTEEAQEQLARVLGYRLKTGAIDYTIGQYLKAKVSALTATFSREKRNQFYAWLEGTVGKMLDVGMLYYTEININEYRNVIEKEMQVFLNLMYILRLFLDFSDRKYILQDVDSKQIIFYIRCLTNFARGGRINLSKVDLSRVDLNRVDLSGADLREADLKRVKLVAANLSGAILSGVDLSGADLNKSDLVNADLRNAVLGEVKLVEANLREADLRGADLRVANLFDTNLIRTNLGEANLRISELIRVDLRNADLRRADLRNANLNRSNLSGTDLREANLSGVDLSGVSLRGANLDRSRWSKDDVEKYIDLIKQSEFDEIYICSEKTGEETLLTRKELLTKYPDYFLSSPEQHNIF